MNGLHGGKVDTLLPVFYFYNAGIWLNSSNFKKYSYRDKKKVSKIRMKFKDITARIVANAFLFLASSWVYLGVILGIIAPMVIAFPMYLISWAIFDQLFYPNHYFELWIYLADSTHKPGVIVFIVFGFIIFAVGLFLFLWGLIALAMTIFKKEGLSKREPYKFLRHPQHTGMILMSLVVSLYLPWTNDLGIRTGAVLSWSLFAFLVILWSYYEEWRLSKKYGEDYLQYKTETGAFFPKVFKINKNRESPPKIKHLQRLLFTFLGYICFIGLLWLIGWILYKEGIFVQMI